MSHMLKVKTCTTNTGCSPLEYALKGGCNIQFTRWGGVKSEVKCGVEVDEREIPCSWRIYCLYKNLFHNGW